ncbi:phosphoribosyltransferase family protein [Gordonia sputi]|uniref:phosphoribosyltransferase family protein n=1 Tax=Gordonia sputi TaxID=36823 RepID=UPI00204453ED|nr:phosphoribosyltransferase family protein [Gordonia sputi]MCM3897654.1 phosphoribosyltransferase family protein [Gordonia sputi]
MTTTSSRAAHVVDSANAPSWVADTFGVRITDLTDTPTGAESGWNMDELVVLGLRRNRRRAHLLVSTVLGKHIPTPPERVRRAADDLAALIRDRIGAEAAEKSTVLGFAETATGLGHCVFHALDAHAYLHSTRRRPPGALAVGSFEEGHSHATTHLLQPSSIEVLSANPDSPLILVDDEISTGATALRAITAIYETTGRREYVIASLVDLRSPEHRQATDDFASSNDVRIEYVSLAQGSIDLPSGLTDAVWESPSTPLNPLGARAEVVTVTLPWPADVPEGGRHGFLRSDTQEFTNAVDDAVAVLLPELDSSKSTVVVGHEELMYLPLCIAEGLARAGIPTTFQTTTRSPAFVRDVDGYPLRRGLTFTAPEHDPGTPRFVYNLLDPDGSPDLPRIVLIIDDPADTPDLTAQGGVLDVMTAAGHDVVVAKVIATGQGALRDARSES